MSALLHIIRHNDLVSMSIAFLGIIAGWRLMQIPQIAPRRGAFAYLVSGMALFIAGFVVFMVGLSSGVNDRRTIIEIHALADCKKFDAVPARLGERTDQFYCAKLQGSTQPRDAGRMAGPDPLFTRNCLSLKGTVLEVPYGEAPSWACGSVVAYGYQPVSEEPYVFYPLP